MDGQCVFKRVPSRSLGGRPRKSISYSQDSNLTFGDLFFLCGSEHPNFPPLEFGSSELARRGVEQMHDYFAICRHGEPIVWILPLVKGRVVEHHSGPFDGIQIELSANGRDSEWSTCRPN